MQKKIIFSIIAIIIILVVVFWSRRAVSGGFGKTLISDATNQAQAYLAKGANWALSKVYPTISGEVQKRGDMISNAVGNAQKNISENVGQKISNYFSGIANAVVHPGIPQNCPATPVTQPTQTSANP